MFRSAQIEQFGKTYDVDAEDFGVEFDEDDRSTVLECDVLSKISKSGNRYTATFLWFLNPLGLDFIDDDFDESNTSLSWNGTVNSVSTTVIIDLPPQDSIYEAWGQPIGHCHGHVWWPG